MNIMKSMIAMSLVALFMSVASVDLCAQTTSAKAGSDDKKEAQKEKVVERVVEKSGPSVEQQLRKMFNSKSETSLSAPRLENMGVFFLDKHTGDVTVMGVYKSESVRWRIQRDSVADDVVNEDQLVNYQLIDKIPVCDSIAIFPVDFIKEHLQIGQFMQICDRFFHSKA